MPTKDIMSALLDYLREPGLSLSQVEPYDGQFEDVSDFVIVPPAAFVAIEAGTSSAQQSLDLDYRVTIYLVSQHIMHTSPDNMLDILDAVSSALHFKPVNVSGYFGRILLDGFEWLGIFPGLSVYKLSFSIRT